MTIDIVEEKEGNVRLLQDRRAQVVSNPPDNPWYFHLGFFLFFGFLGGQADKFLRRTFEITGDNWVLAVVFFGVLIGGWRIAYLLTIGQKVKEHEASITYIDKQIEDARIELARIKRRVEGQ